MLLPVLPNTFLSILITSLTLGQIEKPTEKALQSLWFYIETKLHYIL